MRKRETALPCAAAERLFFAWGACQGGGCCGFLPTPLERQGTEPSRAGPYFFEEIGERTPRGRRFLPLGTPFSGGRNGGRWFRQVGAWPAASKTNASWPAHQLGRAGEVVYCREEKWKPERLLSAFSQRVPRHVPSPPSRWAGRYGPFNVRAAGQVTSEKYNLPPHNPTREGSPEGRTSSLWGSFPYFLPRNGAPAGQAKVPCRSNGVGTKPQGYPAREGQVPARSNSAEKTPRQCGKNPRQNLKDQESVILWQNSPP